MKNTISDFEIIDHGIDGAQYFPGCGTSFTDFNHVVTGCGDTFAEAMEDALDSAGQCDVDTYQLACRIAEEGFGKIVAGSTIEWQESRSATEEARKSNGQMSDDEWEDSLDTLEVYYYVSIRYNVAD